MVAATVIATVTTEANAMNNYYVCYNEDGTEPMLLTASTYDSLPRYTRDLNQGFESLSDAMDHFRYIASGRYAEEEVAKLFDAIR